MSEREPELLADETLDAHTGARPGAAQLDQRFVHGLLRAMHGADASSREARVQAILQALPPAAGRWRRRLPLLAAAAAVLALLLWLPWTEDLPRADALVRQALEQLSADVDHRYRVEVALRAADGTDTFDASYDLTVGTGGRFLLSGAGLLGPMQVGSDGEIVWCNPALALLRWSRPRKVSSRLGTMLSHNEVETADLDLHGLIQGLTKRARTVAVQRVQPDRGAARIRVEARDLPLRRGHSGRSVQLDRLAFEVEENSGALQRIEVERRPVPGWSKQLVFVYQGVAAPGTTRYTRPW